MLTPRELNAYRVIGILHRNRYDDFMMNRAVVVAVLRRPSLWLEGVRTAVALAPRGWWRRRPFLPLPDRAYMTWRIHTAYGRSRAQMIPRDVLSYLEWRKRQRSQG